MAWPRIAIVIRRKYVYCPSVNIPTLTHRTWQCLFYFVYFISSEHCSLCSSVCVVFDSAHENNIVCMVLVYNATNIFLPFLLMYCSAQLLWQFNDARALQSNQHQLNILIYSNWWLTVEQYKKRRFFICNVQFVILCICYLFICLFVCYVLYQMMKNSLCAFIVY